MGDGERATHTRGSDEDPVHQVPCGDHSQSIPSSVFLLLLVSWPRWSCGAGLERGPMSPGGERFCPLARETYPAGAVSLFSGLLGLA